MNVDLPFINLTGSAGFLFGLIGGVLLLIVHVAFTIGVWMDVQRMSVVDKRGTFVAAGWVWALAVLFGGVFAVAVYWLIHHSTLRRISPVDQAAHDLL